MRPWERDWSVQNTAKETIKPWERNWDVDGAPQINAVDYNGTALLSTPGENSSPFKKMSLFMDKLFTFEVRDATEKNKNNPRIQALEKATGKDASSVDWGEVGKSAVRGTLDVGKTLTAEPFKIYGDWSRDKRDISKLSKEEAQKAKYNNFISDCYEKVGGYIEKIWDLGLNSEWLKEDEKIFAGSFVENPSLTRVLSLGAGAIPSILYGGAIAKITKSPSLAAIALSGADSSDIYWGAREAGESSNKALGLWAAGTAGTAAFEKYGLEQIFNNKIMPFSKRIVTSVLSEGLTEGTQTAYQNMVKKYGYDDTQALMEGVVESMIGGAIGGGTISTVYGGYVRLEQARNNLKEKGLTDSALDTIQEGFAEEIAKHRDTIEPMFQQNINKSLSTLEKFVAENEGTAEAQKALQTKQELEDVYTNVYDQLKAAGVEDNVANADAKIWQGIALWGSQELGVSPAEYMKRMPKIERMTYGQFQNRGKTLEENLDDYIPYQLSPQAYDGQGQVSDEQLEADLAEFDKILDSFHNENKEYYDKKGKFASARKIQKEYQDFFMYNIADASNPNGQHDPFYFEYNGQKDFTNMWIPKKLEKGSSVILYRNSEQVSIPVTEFDESKFKKLGYKRQKKFDEGMRDIYTLDKNVKNDRVYYQGQIAENGRDVELTINSQEEMQGLSDEDFKTKMLDTLKSFKGNKIFNQSLNGDIEIRTSSIKKYKSFFADKNKRLIVPYIPELLGKAKFIREESYTKASEPNIKAYYKADMPINIDEDKYNVRLTVREDQYGNFFWDAQIKEEPQRATPATNPGDTGLTSEMSEDGLSITQTSENVNNTLYQGREDPKGAYMKNLDYNGIIYLFERADASTFMHETAHFFKEELKRFDTERSREMLKKVNEWENSQFDQRYNIKEENGNYAVTDKLGMVVYDNFDSAERAREYGKSEIFARGFEQYLRDGQAPNNYLKQAFRSFWGWLKHLYNSAKQLNVSLNEDIKAVYADIIGGKDLDFYLSAPVDEVLQQHFTENKNRKAYLDEQISIAQGQPVKKSFADSLAQEKTDGAKGRNEWWSKAIIPISTRAKRVNQGLKNRLRAYDFSLANKLNAYYAEIKPFLDKWATMTEQDAVAFDLALKNNYMEKQLEIVNKYGAYDEFVKVKNLLNSLFDQAIGVGIEMGYTADYFPRQIKDVEGFMSYIYGSSMSSQLRRALREADPDNVMKPEERAEFLNKYLRGFKRFDLNKPLPGNTKDRRVDVVTAELNKFYAPSMEALISYVEGMNTAIESRRFWGFKYDDINRSIGAFTAQMIDDGLISPEQDVEVQEILRARFNARGVHSGWLNWHKNMAYIYTMGGINSAITQIDDLSMSLYKAGFWNTVQSVFSKNRPGLSREELGLEKIGQEFAEASASSKLVSAVFKATGLDKIDAFGKNTLINATFNKFQKMANTDETALRERIAPVLEQETNQTIEDIKNGVISENVKLLMFNELADVQPIALSEMPQWYLTSGNGRVFYMLKSFALKRIDIFRNECFDKMRNGQVKEGLQNLFKLAMLMMICGASKDMLIDLLYGRDVEISETFINNLLGLTGIVNKYSLYKLRDEGFSGILSAQIPPIFPFYSDLVGDVYKSLFTTKGKDISDYEIWKGLPLIGRFYYWWFGGGRTKLEKKEKKKLK